MVHGILAHMRKFAIVAIFGGLLCFPFHQVLAQSKPVPPDTVEAVVTKIDEETEGIPAGATGLQLYQKLDLVLTSGSQKGKTITLENGNLPMADVQKYVVGDKLVLNHGKDLSGKDEYTIEDYVRRGALLWAFIVFVLVAIAIGARRGFTSLIGMGISFSIIFLYTLPTIAHRGDPMTAAIISSFIIVPVTFYLSHGFNKKTTVAIVGTFISLVITGMLANYFVVLAHLTGYGSEEAGIFAGILSRNGEYTRVIPCRYCYRRSWGSKRYNRFAGCDCGRTAESIGQNIGFICPL